MSVGQHDVADDVKRFARLYVAVGPLDRPDCVHGLLDFVELELVDVDGVGEKNSDRLFRRESGSGAGAARPAVALRLGLGDWVGGPRSWHGTLVAAIGWREASVVGRQVRASVVAVVGGRDPLRSLGGREGRRFGTLGAVAQFSSSV